MRLANGIIIGLLLAAGCVSHRPPTTQPTADRFESAPASALVFDPPITAGQLPLELIRADREAQAFLSFGQSTQTYYELRVDDHDNGIRGGRYDREALSERVGVSYR